ncbi:MAG: orc1/cdc6 family replication initiation protein [Nanoarchaeota archaeon]|nr:orc1/cdc6 family replication initiation protein [Nanoarchaeota archaeon]
MGQQTLKDIFGVYIQNLNPIFHEKNTLTDRHIPLIIEHREEQINTLAKILAPAIRDQKISNTFIFGNVGTGKTLVTKHVTAELAKNNPKINILYVNCKMRGVSDTEYRLLAELLGKLGKEVPSTGLPTTQLYKNFYTLLEETEKLNILILDEIDVIVKKIGDEILYNLTRINQDLKKSTLSLIGISNDVSFTEQLDPRVKSSLSEEELIFPPYNAMQLQNILTKRAETAFTLNTLSVGVIAKCAALAAQEHGDARKALDLLRIAGEIAERENSKQIIISHVDCAEEKLDSDRTVEAVRTQPKQSLAVLASIILLSEEGKEDIQTGDVFEIYQKICANRGLKILTQRRVSDLIGALDMVGIINTHVISKGRYGRTREIRILLSQPILKKIRTILEDNYLFDGLGRYSKKKEGH